MVNITCVCRDKNGNITHLGAKEDGITTSDRDITWTIFEVEHEINDNGVEFYVNGEVKIERRYNEAGTFMDLTTEADGNPNNNLGNLKNCNTCK